MPTATIMINRSDSASHGFIVSAEVLTVRADRVVIVDFHPWNILLYAELDVERGFAYNENIDVNPLCRRRGIGARLLAALEEICRAGELTILINNNRNPAFWKRQGYRRLNPFWQMRLARRLDVEFMAHSVSKKVQRSGAIADRRAVKGHDASGATAAGLLAGARKKVPASSRWLCPTLFGGCLHRGVAYATCR